MLVEILRGKIFYVNQVQAHEVNNNMCEYVCVCVCVCVCVETGTCVGGI